MRRFLQRTLLTLAVLLLLAVAALLALHQGQSIRTEISIDAPTPAVWRILTDTADYPAWNPMISRLTGDLREGNTIEFAAGTGPNAMVFHPILLVVRPNRELRWRGYVWLPHLYDGEHDFLLQPEGNRTRFIQTERFTGLFAGRLTRSIAAQTIDDMNEMNRALKQRAESQR